MFPRTENRIGTFLRRSVDAAIDFATLGEYGLASAMEGPSMVRLAPLPPRPDVLSVALAPPAVPAVGPLALAAAPKLSAADAARRSGCRRAPRLARGTGGRPRAAPPAAPPTLHSCGRSSAASPHARGGRGYRWLAPSQARGARSVHCTRRPQAAGSATRTDQLCFFID